MERYSRTLFFISWCDLYSKRERAFRCANLTICRCRSYVGCEYRWIENQLKKLLKITPKTMAKSLSNFIPNPLTLAPKSIPNQSKWSPGDVGGHLSRLWAPSRSPEHPGHSVDLVFVHVLFFRIAERFLVDFGTLGPPGTSKIAVRRKKQHKIEKNEKIRIFFFWKEISALNILQDNSSWPIIKQDLTGRG